WTQRRFAAGDCLHSDGFPAAAAPVCARPDSGRIQRLFMSSKQFSEFAPVKIGRSEKWHCPLGMGGSFYGLDHSSREGEADILVAMAEALEQGITHFDTGSG